MQDRNLIGGEWRTAHSRETFPVHDAATGELLANVPRCGASEAKDAIDAATAALRGWSGVSPTERAVFLTSIAQALRERRTQLAEIITAECGKPLDEAQGEVDYGADYFLSAADEANRLQSETIKSRRPDRAMIAIPEPVGVVAAITPWNFPLAMLARKTAPALAVGCTQVVKPAELTPLTALAYGQLLIDVGLPAGVVNVITGDPAVIGQAWLGDGRVRKLSFTGSTAVGRLLMKLAADQVVRLSLELGGHAPFIVFSDADIPTAVAAAVNGKFRVAGQTCVCPNRFIVANEVYDEFVSKFAASASSLKIGRGRDAGVRVGPLIDDRAVTRIRNQIQDAVARGATIVTGGTTVPVEGCLDRFFAPTVLANATSDMLCFREETFGPLAPVATFQTEAQAIEIANATPYGLASYVFSSDSARIERITRQLNYGIVGVNTGVISDAYAPFGGRGWSGFGREGGRWGIEEYISWKYVCASVNA